MGWADLVYSEISWGDVVYGYQMGLTRTRCEDNDTCSQLNADE